jgi:outer membrane protein
MLNGLSKKTHLVIILFSAVVLTLFLATRVKSVVKDKEQAVQQNSSSESTTQNDNHGITLSEEAKTKVTNLNADLIAVSDSSQKINIFSSLADIYRNESVFDSAGYYYASIAELQPSVTAWSLAGDAYYQGYNLALDPQKMETFVEKTRVCYNKVLSIQPSNLNAKTNLAMTFVKTDSPMKAITMLREVLIDEPNYIPAIMSLGGLSLQSNQYDKAAARFQYVLKLDPKNTNAKLGLAYSFIELEKKTEAIQLFNEVLATNVDKVMKDEITKTLNSLK